MSENLVSVRTSEAAAHPAGSEFLFLKFTSSAASRRVVPGIYRPDLCTKFGKARLTRRKRPVQRLRYSMHGSVPWIHGRIRSGRCFGDADH